MKNLTSPDKDKREGRTAQRLDKTVSEDKRRKWSGFKGREQSPDKDKQEAARRNYKEMKKQMEQEQANKNGQQQPSKEPKEPSHGEIAGPDEEAQDLNSKDDKTREQAEKDSDDKIARRTARSCKRR